MKKNIGYILMIINLSIACLILKILNIPIDMDSLFWVFLINLIVYIIEVYLLIGRKKDSNG